METPRAIPHDMWEQLPPEAQAYMRSLEVRVEALEAMVQALQEHNRALQEQLQPHGTLRVPLRATRPKASGHIALGVSAVVVVSLDTLAIPAPCSRWKQWMRWW